MFGGFDRIRDKAEAEPFAPDVKLAIGGPFAILVGQSWRAVSRQRAQAHLNRMGLRPIAAAPWDDMGFPCFRLSVGGAQMVIGPAQKGWLAKADPKISDNSKVAVTLPDDMQKQGSVWLCRPDGWAATMERSREYYMMMGLLCDAFQADALYWEPARLWSDGDMARDAIYEYLASGLPPVLHMIAFRRGADDGVRTRGLHHFSGQEIEAVLPPEMDLQGLIGRLAHLAMLGMMDGAYGAGQRVAGLAEGEWIQLDLLEKQADGTGLVRAEICRSQRVESGDRRDLSA